VAAPVDVLRAHGLDADAALRDPAGGVDRSLTDRLCFQRRVAEPGGTAHDPARLAAALSDLVG